MSDVNSQATDEPITQQEEVAETTPAEGSTQEQPQKEAQPLTRDDILTMLREVIPQSVQPLIQSQVAKGENRINQRITERFAALDANKSVLKLSDDQVQTAKRDIINEEQMNAFASQQSPQAGGQVQAPSKESVDPGQFVEQQINNTFDLVGTKVTPQDVEWAMIQKELDDPNGSLAKTQLAAAFAAKAKGTRLAAQQKNATARVTSTGGGSTVDPSDISNITDSKTLYKLGEKKLGEKK